MERSRRIRYRDYWARRTFGSRVIFDLSCVSIATVMDLMVYAACSPVRRRPASDLITFGNKSIPEMPVHGHDPQSIPEVCVSSAESDFGVGEQLTDHALATIADASRLHVCCRRPLDTSRFVPLLRGRPYSVDFFLPSIQTNVQALRPVIDDAEGVFVNAAEFAALRDLVEVSRLRLVVVTDGPRSAVALRHGRIVADVQPPVAQAVEVTGAGDTVTGVFLASKATGQDDRDALRSAVQAASRSLRLVDLPIA